jgi:hypothetical protein
MMTEAGMIRRNICIANSIERHLSCGPFSLQDRKCKTNIGATGTPMHIKWCKPDAMCFTLHADACGRASCIPHTYTS